MRWCSLVALPSQGHDPRPQVPQQILCTECRTPLHFFGSEGFCRVCGGPLCPICSNSKMHYEKTIDTVVPMVIVTYHKTVRLWAEVTVCRSCILAIGAKRTRDVFRVMKGGIVALLAGVVPLAFFSLVLAVLFGMLVVLLTFVTYLYIGTNWQVQIVPCCPACSTIVLPALIKEASSHDGQHTLTNYVVCTSCGYQGPRVPLEGLWKFVDYHGPTPLDGTFLQKPAQHSWRVRHGPRKKWWQIF